MSGVVVRLQGPERKLPAVAAPRPSVLVIGVHCFGDSMEAHVMAALRELGCVANFFEARAFGGIQSNLHKAMQKAANLLLREPERLVEKRLLETVERVRPDLVLVILGSHLSPKSMRLLRMRTQVPIVCWCQDQMTTLGRQYLIGSGYDAVFVKDRYMQDLFSRMVRSTPFYYLPEACNPRVHRSVELSPQDLERFGCDVMMAGSLYYYRQEILRSLTGFKLRIYGYKPSWLLDKLGAGHCGFAVYGDDKARAARGATVALNTLHYAEVDALNCRAFELAGIGAFQLVDHKPVLAEHFRPGEEIESYANIDELVEKVRYYVANPERARQIANAGQRRAHRDHSYEVRLRSIFQVALGTREAMV